MNTPAYMSAFALLLGWFSPPSGPATLSPELREFVTVDAPVVAAHKGSIRSIRRATPLSARSARSSHAMSRLRRPWRKQRLTNRVVLPLTHASVT